MCEPTALQRHAASTSAARPPTPPALRSIVPLHPPAWSLDPTELEAAFTPRTRLLVLNTPHNPTGKVGERTPVERLCAMKPFRMAATLPVCLCLHEVG